MFLLKPFKNYWVMPMVGKICQNILQKMLLSMKYKYFLTKMLLTSIALLN